MKRIISLAIVVAFVIPNLALASWWNPTTWFNNWSSSKKTDTKTEVLEKRIQELESKLNTPTTTPIVTKFYIKYDNSRVRACASTTGCDVIAYYNRNSEIIMQGEAIYKLDTLPEWIEHTTSNGLKGYINKSILSDKPVEVIQTMTGQSQIKTITDPVQKPQPTKMEVKSEPQSQAKPVNIQYLTKVEIAEFISRLKESISSTDKIQRDYNSEITSKIRPEMAEYPNNQSLQQAGQDVIAEFNNNIALMNKVDAESMKVINSMSPHLNSDVPLTIDEVALLGKDLKYYNQQYDASQIKLKALLLSFMNIYSSVLTNETVRMKDLINQTNQTSNQISDKQAKLNAINLEIANLNAKYAQDIKACNSGGGTVSGASACKSAKTSTYTNDYNALMAEYQQIQYSN